MVALERTMAKRDRNGLEAFLTAGEAVADVVMNGDLITSIPFVGLAWKSAKALDDVRDRLFAAKIGRFMFGLGELSEAEKDQMKTAFAERDDIRRIGEVLVLTLENLNDLNKATLMGALFRQYIDNRLSGEDFRRLASAINLVFWDDLSEFIWGHCDSACQTRLTTSGLYSASVGIPTDSYVVIGVAVTSLGRVLQELKDALPRQ